MTIITVSPADNDHQKLSFHAQAQVFTLLGSLAGQLFGYAFVDTNKGRVLFAHATEDGLFVNPAVLRQTPEADYIVACYPYQIAQVHPVLRNKLVFPDCATKINFPNN